MSHSRLGLWRLLLYGILILTPFISAAESPTPLSIASLFKKFREEQASEQVVGQSDKERLLAHMAKIKELHANLTTPKDAAEIKSLDRDMDHDKAALTKVEERIRLAEQSIQGEFLGIPVRCYGTVDRSLGAGWEPVSTHTPIAAGQLVRTATQSSLELVYEDGNRIKVWPESSFKLRAKTASEAQYELVSGKIHVLHKAEAVNGVISRVEYHTPSADTLLLGTEFYLSLDGQNHTHVTITSGAMELTAVPVEVSDFNPPWWKKPLPPPDLQPLIYGKWFRVAHIEGVVEMVREDGIPRRAVVGAELSRSEKLVTKRDGYVWGLLDGGYQAALQPNSILSASLFRKRRWYHLETGTFHVVSVPDSQTQDLRPEFETPTTVIHVKGTEFEAVIDNQGEGDFVPLEGTIEVAAKRRKEK
jgi:hypothetical protein